MSRGKQVLMSVALLMLLVPALAIAQADPKLEPMCFPVFRLTSDTIQPGGTATVDVLLEHPVPISGFDLLIEFEACCFSFVEAKQVGQLSGWEYFQYRYAELTSDSGCPIGRLRVVGMADTADFLPEGRIIELTFSAAQHSQINCACVDLKWAWYDCGDNTMLSLNSDTLYFAYNINDLLPGQDCLASVGEKQRLAVARFMPGEICVPYVSCWQGEGDCNNDGEIDVTDIVHLIQYLFGGGPEPIGNQVCNSFCRANVNCDGKLNLEDVARLVKFIFQQPQPFPCCRD